jgi:asparagine synthase (glutamine-hydrolysing)
MCGILGHITSKTNQLDLNTFNDSLKLMHHRGPNDIGTARINLAENIVILGQTRLSIIDLTSSGHQPMFSADGNSVLIFNGEIYNYIELKIELEKLGHEFKTQSDTEVLLHAWLEWGSDCLIKLTGMFAFAILDKSANSLTLVRDAFGIKPLFLYQKDNTVIFSSEIHSIKHFVIENLEINQQKLYDYLIHGHYDDTFQSFYQDIEHIKPSHLIRFDLNTGLRETQRWWWPSVIENKTISFEQACTRFKELFLKNIMLHMRSDVPVGVALSGGLDSSSVACAVRYLYPNLPIHTFTYVARGTNFDEEKWADYINKYIDATPHKVYASDESLSADLQSLLHHQGEPFGSTSIYAGYKVFQAVNEAGIVVSLDGQGADELLGGYRGYPGERIRSLLERGLLVKAISFLHKWSQWPGRSITLGIFTLVQATLPISWQLLPRKMAGRPAVPNWIKWEPLITKKINPLTSLNSIIPKESSSGRRMISTLRHIVTNGSLVNLLRHGDRNSMRWSVESRVPFLTIELAEFLFSLPESYLVSDNGQTKRLLRSSLRGIVPDEVLDRKDKIGFATPERSWLKKMQISENDMNVLNAHVSYIDSKKLLDRINKIANDSSNMDFQVWRVINVIEWLKINNQTKI